MCARSQAGSVLSAPGSSRGLCPHACSAAATPSHRLGGLDDRHLLLTAQEAGRPGPSPPGSQMAEFLLALHTVVPLGAHIPGVSLCPNFHFL